MGAQRKALWRRQDLAPSPQGTFLQGPPRAGALSSHSFPRGESHAGQWLRAK